jgi:hypothetical protein
MYRRYLIAYGIFLIPLLTPLITNYLYLERAGEYMPLSDIIAEQKAEPHCLYGSGVHSDFVHYKLEGFRQTKPDIIAIGSSRVMQLRQQFFRDSFYNMGGSITSIDTAEHITKLMLEEHVPEVMIIGLDYWWFLEESRFPVKTEKPPKEKQRRHLSSLTLPFTWFKREKITLSDYTDVILRGRGAVSDCRIGTRALHEGSGFTKDGAHDYAMVFRPAEDGILASERFADSRATVTNGEDIDRHFQTVREDQVERFIRLIERLQERGIEVVIFVPPLPPQMQSAISQKPNEHAYLPKLFSLFREKGFSLHNFHNPETLQTNDCEFLDAGHGDKIAFARVLMEISKQGDLQSHVNKQELQRIIGNAATPFTYDVETIRCNEMAN